MLLQENNSLSQSIADIIQTQRAEPKMSFMTSFKQTEMEQYLKQSPSYRKRIFTPDVTLCAFLSQVMGKGSSCQQAVTEVLSHKARSSAKICSTKTSSYARARKKIPLEAIKGLSKNIANDIENSAPNDWLYKDRKIYLIDGSTVSTSDTPENREFFGERKNQGTSYPLARMSAMTSLATGAFIDFEMSSWTGKGTGDLYLGRKMIERLEGNEIIIGDTFYLSYFFILNLKEKNADFVSIAKGNRAQNIIGSKKISHNDRFILLKKPRLLSTSWLDQNTYDAAPKELLLRETIFTVKNNGFREKQIRIISTLIDYKNYSAEDIGKLYGLRWNIELDFRAIKKTIGLEFLKCKTPAMVLKEAWVYVLAYNLLRRLVSEAAAISNQKPRQISMTGALIALSCFKYDLLHPDKNIRLKSYEQLLWSIAKQQVGKRPDRFEPRAVKQRICHNDYDRLRMSRALWKVMTILPHLNLEVSESFKVVLDKILKKMPVSTAKKNKNNYNKRKLSKNKVI
jgi:Transposase DDE domain